MVADENQALSQSDIDSMFKKVAAEAPTAAPQPARPATANPAVKVIPATPAPPSSSPPPSAERLAAIEAALAEVRITISQLRTSAQAGGKAPPPQAEAALAETKAAVGRLQESLQNVAQRLQALQGQMDAVLTGLQGTPAFRVHETFVCNNCNAQGTAAQSVRCTRCGQETWFGWWPPQKQG